MKTAVKLVHISVTTAINDAVDMRCGGPPTLGYDFYVDASKAKKLEEHVKECLKKYGRNCLSISSSKTDFLLPKSKIWTADKIEKCIKTVNP